MEYEKIKQLMDDMGESKLTDIEIEFPDGTKISMKKDYKNYNKAIAVESSIENEIADDSRVITINEQKEVVNENKEVGNVVKSPMVGTFYLKPSPTDAPFVEIGKRVNKGDVLCIIEAMKLMNEIESEFDGTVTEVLVKDGEAVEYGKPLFRIA